MNLQQLNDIFAGIVQRTQGIQSVLLVTDDGFPIVSTMESGDDEGLSTAIGALLTEAGNRSIQEMNLGQLDAIISIGSQGYLIQKRLADNATIMLVASPDVMLGLSLARLRQKIPQILAIYSAMTGSPEE